jgi:hypothetical protein
MWTMNVRDSPPEVTLSLLSPAFSVPGQVDPATDVEVLLDVVEFDPDDCCPGVDLEVLEEDARLPLPDAETDACPEPDPGVELVFCPLLDPEVRPVLDPELGAPPPASTPV